MTDSSSREPPQRGGSAGGAPEENEDRRRRKRRRTGGRRRRRRRARRQDIGHHTVAAPALDSVDGGCGGGGGGIINWMINHLPVELHLPGYRFCGPGTHLQERLKQEGVNRLDELCKQHDLAYSAAKHEEKEEEESYRRHRTLADQELRRGAKLLAGDPSVPLTERLAARLVAGVMKVKIALEKA